jgi:shikimate dehydrogenase
MRLTLNQALTNPEIKPKLLGLIGEGISASRTPNAHMNEGKAQGLTVIYQLLDMLITRQTNADLPAILDGCERYGFSGVNVTFPAKQAIIPFLDELSPDATALQAVNTVLFKNGKRIGHNTDFYGFAEGFRQEMQNCSLEHVVQFGSGGAGAAVLHALLTLGAKKVTLIDTNIEKRDETVTLLAKTWGEKIAITNNPEETVKAASGIVNATPVGMAKLPGTPFNTEWLAKNHWVSDVIYFPIETELLKAARAKGCKVQNGLNMSIYQGVEAFRHFTGLEANVSRMASYFEGI